MIKDFMTIHALDWHDRVNAKRIKDVYPDVQSVHIILERDGSAPIEYNLSPEDKIHLSIDCLNPDCTSKFLLTSTLEYALRAKRKEIGSILCNGRESKKPGAYSCSCRLRYSIEPFYVSQTK